MEKLNLSVKGIECWAKDLLMRVLGMSVERQAQVWALGRLPG